MFLTNTFCQVQDVSPEGGWELVQKLFLRRVLHGKKKKIIQVLPQVLEDSTSRPQRRNTRFVLTKAQMHEEEKETLQTLSF